MVALRQNGRDWIAGRGTGLSDDYGLARDLQNRIG